MLSYKPLSQIVIENKELLTAQLVGNYNTSDVNSVRQICKQYVHSLTNKDSEYMNQLSLLEQDVVSPALSMFKELPIEEILVDIYNNARALHFNTKQIGDNDIPTYKFLIGHIISATCGAIVASFICGESIIAGIIVGLIIGSLLGFVFFWHIKKKYKLSNCISGQELDDSHELSIDDVNCIIDYLSQSVASIDDILNIYRSHIKQLIEDNKQLLDRNTLDEHYKDVIETLQYVLGNISFIKEVDPALSNDTIRRISSSLAHHGYKIIHFSEDAKALFQIETRQTTTLDEFKPAIVKIVNGKEYLICEGAVVLPNN